MFVQRFTGRNWMKSRRERQVSRPTASAAPTRHRKILYELFLNFGRRFFYQGCVIPRVFRAGIAVIPQIGQMSKPLANNRHRKKKLPKMKSESPKTYVQVSSMFAVVFHQGSAQKSRNHKTTRKQHALLRTD